MSEQFLNGKLAYWRLFLVKYHWELDTCVSNCLVLGSAGVKGIFGH